MNRHETEIELQYASDCMSDAIRAFNNSNAYDFENAIFNLRKHVRTIEAISIAWADEVMKTERIRK